MDEDNIEQQMLDWVSENKHSIANAYLGVIRNASSSPNLVIMAGYPGSGMTEYIKTSPELSLLPTIDLDDLVALMPNYKPKNYYDYLKAAGRLLALCFEKAIKMKLSFILEGTFSSQISLLNIERALKRGYVIEIIRLNTPKDIAWQYAEFRRITTGRPTSNFGFDQTVINADIIFKQALELYSEDLRVSVREVQYV